MNNRFAIWKICGIIGSYGAKYSVSQIFSSNVRIYNLHYAHISAKRQGIISSGIKSFSFLSSLFFFGANGLWWSFVYIRLSSSNICFRVALMTWSGKIWGTLLLLPIDSPPPLPLLHHTPNGRGLTVQGAQSRKLFEFVMISIYFEYPLRLGIMISTYIF